MRKNYTTKHTNGKKESAHSQCLMTLHINFYHKRDTKVQYTQDETKKKKAVTIKKMNSQRSTGKKVNTGHLWTKETKEQKQT